MNFDSIFEQYYTLYSAERTVPVGAGIAFTSADDEYVIGMRLANEAIHHWQHYDNTYWKELFTTNQLDNSTGTQVITAGVSVYTAPSNLAEYGGNVRIKNSSGSTVRTYPIKEIQEVQSLGEGSTFAYFRDNPTYYSTGTVSQSGTTITGSGTTFTSAMVGMTIQYASGETATISAYSSATSLTASVDQTVASTTYKIVSNGLNLVLNPVPDTTINGMDIEYDYYKTPVEITTGKSIPDMKDPYFIVHRMLANRLRVTRNPYYDDALRDSENALRVMQMENNSGSWANPWQITDNSGSIFGV